MKKICHAIILAGLTVCVLDGIAAIASSAVRGISADRVFQYISSGLLGRVAFDGGWLTVLLGVLLHFVVAFGVSAFFVVAARSWTSLNRYPLLTGTLYGVAVYFFMNEFVSALSCVARGPRTIAGTLTRILVHIFFVGLPIVFINSRYSDPAEAAAS